MSEWIFEKLSLTKRVKRWRWIALLAIIALVGVSFVAFSSKNQPFAPHIAQISMSGIVKSDEKQLKLIEKLKNDPMVKGLYLVIDSPGGTTVGAESIYDALRSFQKEKPLVAQIETLGASGGYIVALASDHIVARKTSIVGSIGVIMQYPNVTKLLETLGVKYEEIKSSPLKASPHPFENASPEAKAAMASMINASYLWFTGLVSERRALNGDALKNVSDGRVFTGEQALALKLIDQTGGRNEALEYLYSKGLNKTMTVKAYEPEKPKKSFIQQIVADSLGIEPITNQINAKLETQGLNGLLVFWYP